MSSEIFQAIAAGKVVVDGLKTLRGYADEVKDVGKRGEFMKIIGELSIELAETQIRLGAIIRENDDLREKVNTLKKENEKLKNPDTKLVFKHGLYYTSEDDGPYCTGCYDSKGQTIRVSEVAEELTVAGKYRCPVCNQFYRG